MLNVRGLLRGLPWLASFCQRVFRRGGVGFLWTVLLLAGCVEPLQLEGKLTMPDDYEGAGKEGVPQPIDAKQISHWWQTFTDPLLTGLIDQAVQENYDVQLALVAVQKARSDMRLSRSALWPKLGYAASGNRYLTDSDSSELEQLGYDDDLRVDYWQSGLQASWELDLFGSSREQLSAAKEKFNASQAQVYATRLSIAATVAEAYFEFRGVQARIAVLLQGLDIANQFVEITDKRFASGDLQRSDVLAAQSERDTINAQLQQLRSSEEQLRLTLEQLCVLPPGSLQTRLSRVDQLPTLSPRIAAGQPIDLLLRRPDLMALQAQFRAALANTRSRRDDLWPSISLSGALGRSGLYLDGDRVSLGDLTQVGAMFSLPLLDGGTRRGRIEQADSQAEQALLAYEQGSWGALFEVEQALMQLHYFARQVESLQAAVTRRQQMIDVSLRRFDVGDLARPELLQVQRDWLESQNKLLAAKVELLSTQVDLYKALGGGWEPGMTDTGDPEKHAIEWWRAP